MIYLGKRVLDLSMNFDDNVDHGQIDDFVYDSNSGGVAVPWKATTKPKRTLTLNYLLQGLEEIHALRSFIGVMDGRRGSFWVPTWLTDYALIQNESAGASTIKIMALGITEKTVLSDSFSHLAILTRDGKFELYHIESSSITLDQETITLDRGLATDLIARETVCCGLMLVRLADDETQFKYECSDVATCQLKLVELPTEVSGAAATSKPVYFYKFQRGSLVWTYTSWPADLTTVDTTVWSSADIGHGDIKSDVSFDSEPLVLTVATDNPNNPIRKFLASSLIQTCTVSIFEGDADTLAPDLTAPIHTGRAGEVTFKQKGLIEVKVSSNLRVAERQLPTLQIQRVCNHDTYDQFCGVNPATFTTAGTITAINGASVDAVEFGAKATAETDPNWFALGRVTRGEEIRLCVGQSGNRLYLNAPFDSAIVGDSISALAGDDKRIGTCRDKFDNQDNFLGFPYIPNTDPQFAALLLPQKTGGKK